MDARRFFFSFAPRSSELRPLNAERHGAEDVPLLLRGAVVREDDPTRVVRHEGGVRGPPVGRTSVDHLVASMKMRNPKILLDNFGENENGWFSKRTMVEKNGKGNNP